MSQQDAGWIFMYTEEEGGFCRVACASDERTARTWFEEAKGGKVTLPDGPCAVATCWIAEVRASHDCVLESRGEPPARGPGGHRLCLSCQTYHRTPQEYTSCPDYVERP